jgi:hypothetical protein
MGNLLLLGRIFFMSVKLTGWKVYRDGELIFDNVDIEIPDMGNLFKSVKEMEDNVGGAGQGTTKDSNKE